MTALAINAIHTIQGLSNKNVPPAVFSCDVPGFTKMKCVKPPV